MSTHNICFYGEISKIIPQLSPNTSVLLEVIIKLPAYHSLSVHKVQFHIFSLEEYVLSHVRLLRQSVLLVVELGGQLPVHLI